MTGQQKEAGAQTFGQWLKQQRRALDLTQAAFAAQAACSTSTVKKIESGALAPSRELAEMIAQVLGVPANERAAFVRFARGLGPSPAPHSAPALPPALPTGAARPTMPAPLTSFIGREREVPAGINLLRSPDVRLLTLVGPPGAGKTRLGIAIASALDADYADGTAFVSLGSVEDAGLAPAAIAQALQVADRSGQSILDALRNYLRGKTLLLLLDNFEHIMPAAGIVPLLLEASPGLKIIVTSREPLKVYGERELPVPPLELPDLDRLPALQTLRQYPSIALFIERAQAARHDFELTAGNAYSVASICAWLDGLPLAIEMAAARVKWHSPEIVLAQLSQRLALAAASPRTVTARQQTLRDAIEWSFELLSDTEKHVLAAVSVFADRFSPAAAGAVCGNILPASGDITGTLQSLAEKSLLIHQFTDGGETRFGMLSVIREYSREKLEQSGLLDVTQQRYAAYYLALAREAQPHLCGPRQQEWFDRLDAEFSNLRAVIDWCAARDQAAGLQMAIALQWFLYARGHLSEARIWLASLLRPSEAGAPAVPASLLAGGRCLAGFFAWQQGDHDQAARLSSQALDYFRQTGDRPGAARALYNLGSVALLQSDYARATDHLTESVALFREQGSAHDIALALNDLGLVAKDQGRFEEAQLHHEESLRLHRQAGNPRGIAQSLLRLSIVAYWQAQFQRAAEMSEQALTLNRRLGNRAGMAYCLDTLGTSLHKLGETTRGMNCLSDGLRLFQELGDRMGMALVGYGMGAICLEQGDRARAAEHFDEALRLSEAIGDKRRAAFALEGLAGALDDSQPIAAARLFGAAQALRATISAPAPVSESASHTTLLNRLLSALGPAGCEAEIERGRSWTLADALACAQDALNSTRPSSHP